MELMTWVAGASLAIAGPVSVEKSSPEGKRALSVAAGHALQGKMMPALAALRSVPTAVFSEKDLATRDCMIARFGSGRDEDRRVAGLVTNRALVLYRSYWRASLLEPEKRGLHEERLIKRLRVELGLRADATAANVEVGLRQRIIAEGNHVLLGRTPPLLEFIAWGRETSTVRQVRLPERQRAVTVKLLDDFTSLGWSAYATCDRSFTGGWVKPDGIYAVRPGWKDLAAENFQVSFLAHETQHFVDKERFKELQSWELEYRAKLAELALADVTIPRILSAFASNQGGDPSVPHAFANRIVLSWLVSALKLDRPDSLVQVAPQKIRQVARGLLSRDSASRIKQANAPRRPPR